MGVILSNSMKNSRSRSMVKAMAKRKAKKAILMRFGGIGVVINDLSIDAKKIQRKPISVKIKPRKCKICPNKFTPSRPMQQVCSPACAVIFGRKVFEKQEANKWKTIKNGLKTMYFYEKKLQHEVNTIARLIDYGQTCISCNKNGKPQAGHRHSIGANKTIRFNLHNLHFQDYRCNVELSGNPDNYDKGLTAKYGQQYQEYVNQTLVHDYPILKWSKDDLIEAAKKARKIIREYQPKILEAKERIKIRTKLNKLIGIYK